MKKDVFQNCPTYQSERFEIRKMEMNVRGKVILQPQGKEFFT